MSKHVTSLRELAIERVLTLSQSIFAEDHQPGLHAYYVDRKGRISIDEYVWRDSERWSVRAEGKDREVRIGTTGLGEAGYSGDEGDYRTLDPIPAAHQSLFEDGRGIGDFIDVVDLDPETDEEENDNDD